MAPSIPTHRPLVTATRVAVTIAIAACASSLYLAFGNAWAGTGEVAFATAAYFRCNVEPSHGSGQSS